MISGDCKRKMPLRDGDERKKKNGKSRKPFASRVTHMNPGHHYNGANFSNISDEAMAQVGEFMEWVNLMDDQGDGSGAVLPEPGDMQVTDAPQGSVEDEEHIQELTDMGLLARDLVRRIQRLRGGLRPGSAAAAALPDLRMDGDDDVGDTGQSIAFPLVEGMD